MLLASRSSRCLAGIPALTSHLPDPQTGWCLQPQFARFHLRPRTARKLRMLPEFITDSVHLQAQTRAVELAGSKEKCIIVDEGFQADCILESCRPLHHLLQQCPGPPIDPPLDLQTCDPCGIFRRLSLAESGSKTPANRSHSPESQHPSTPFWIYLRPEAIHITHATREISPSRQLPFVLIVDRKP